MPRSFSPLCALALFASSLEASHHPLPRGAYTYEISSGSLGDHLLTYARARWLSYRFDRPLIVRPFPFSDQLCLHVHGLNVDDVGRAAWDKRRSLSADPLLHQPLSGEIWEVPAFPESVSLTATHLPWVPFFQVDWTDLLFLQDLRSAICPLAPVPEPHLPEDRLCVAIHWKGESSRPEPPYQPSVPGLYFQKELQKLLRRVGSRPVYIHLFTEDPYPAELLTCLKEAAQGYDTDIVWSTRRAEVPASHRVLEDLFYMARFDVLMRGHSPYALIAARIGDVAVEICPADYDSGPRTVPNAQWRIKPGTSLESLLDGWRVRWRGHGRALYCH
jgi:hypothetical protein